MQKKGGGAKSDYAVECVYSILLWSPYFKRNENKKKKVEVLETLPMKNEGHGNGAR